MIEPYVGRSGGRVLLEDQRPVSIFEEVPDAVAATGRLRVRFTDLGALQRFVGTINNDGEDVFVQNIEWELTATTKERVRRALRRDALAQLRQVGREYEDAFGVVLDSMYDYSEEDSRRGCLAFDRDDGDDGDDGLSSESLHGWDTIRRFFAVHDEGDEDARAESRIGRVSMVLYVRCKFGTTRE